MVILKYSPDGSVPKHLRAIFRTKGQEYPAGQEVTTTPERAALVISSAPPGSMQVVSGKPSAAPAVLPASMKRSQKAIAERA